MPGPAGRDPEGPRPNPPDGRADPVVGRLRQILPDAWRMIRPYWFSEDRWPARGLLLVVVAFTLGMVYLSVLLNQWNNDFFSALQERNSTMFPQQLVRACWLLGGFTLPAASQPYPTQN